MEETDGLDTGRWTTGFLRSIVSVARSQLGETI